MEISGSFSTKKGSGLTDGSGRRLAEVAVSGIVVSGVDRGVSS